MSVQSEINRINSAVSDAYSAVSDKGGEMPSVQNVANLANAVSSIPTGGESDIFVVEYETTPFADIVAAHLANKVCVIFDASNTYYLIAYNNNGATFSYPAPNGENKTIVVTSTGVWLRLDTQVILKSAISTTISSSSTDDQVASAKAVYDYIQSLDAREVSY